MKSEYEELKKKRLLILGGSLWIDEIEEFCKKNEIIIVAAGNNPASVMCKISNEYYNVDTTDYGSMLKLIKDKNIDGVYMGGNEPVISVACQYINDAGLPCFCTKDQWDIFQNKDKFKNLCEQFELPVVKKFQYSEVCDKDFPVVVKPVDGCGSIGFHRCNNEKELRAAYENVKSISASGSAIIENFVHNGGGVFFYTIVNGKLIFSGSEDKYPVYYNEYGTYLGGLFDFGCKYEDEFRQKYEKKITEAIESIGIKHGNFWLEVFINENGFYFNEAGFRCGGSVSVYPIKYLYGIDQVAMDISFALTGNSSIALDGIINKKDIGYAIYPIILQHGMIDRVDGLDELKSCEGIEKIIEKLGLGDSVPDNGSFGHAGFLIHMTYTDKRNLLEKIQFIQATLKVYDKKSRNLVRNLFSTTCLG